MRDDELHGLARECALGLPAASAGWPFGPEHEVMKVRGKVFLMLTVAPESTTGFGTENLRGRPILTLKAEPEDSEALRRQHPSIAPGYHMNKKHWISATTGPTIDAALVRELVIDSYRLVVESLPKRDRPFGWEDPSILT